jgi:hypothetical protein
MNGSFLALFFTAMLFPAIISAKTLIIVEQKYYASSSSRINRFAQDVRLYDVDQSEGKSAGETKGKTLTNISIHNPRNAVKTSRNKSVEIVPWVISQGTNVQQCRRLWSYLEIQYGIGLSLNDPLEGAVLIGNIPVPQTIKGPVSEPFDYYYMDIWDSRINGQYPNHDMTPFNVDSTHEGYFSTVYNVDGGDSKLDIWISRIYGVMLAANHHLRSSAPGGAPNAVLDEKEIYDEYLDRLHKRYTQPALMPSRGFAIGGIVSGENSLQKDLNMQFLNLPMYVEFNQNSKDNAGEANPFNLMSQLQVGPAGGATRGAYDGKAFPQERNVRYCKYSQLKDARAYAPYNNRIYADLDSSGWEWAGVSTFSSPITLSFNFPGSGNQNGNFSSGTLGPFWGDSLRRSGGYSDSVNPRGNYYYFNDTGISTNPYGWGIWRDKRAFFNYKVHASGIYSIYLYYAACATNDSNDQVILRGYKINDKKNYLKRSIRQSTCFVNMKIHGNKDGGNWELIFSEVALDSNTMVTIALEANGQLGEVRADAVKFACASPTIDDVVDNSSPAVTPLGSAIFTTQGFYTSDWVDRSFESMQDENEGHDKFSKVPFFLLSGGLVNNFLFKKEGSMDNVGNLLALGHNGLICMGTSGYNYSGRSFAPFTKSLAEGKDFGTAFISHANSNFDFDGDHNILCMYALLGAGTLHAQAYVAFVPKKKTLFQKISGLFHKKQSLGN